MREIKRQTPDSASYQTDRTTGQTDLLILDDCELEKFALSQRNYLLKIMEDRHGLKSILITSQLPIIQWHKAIGDATLVDVILDRLLHNSHKLKLIGESM